MNTKLYKKVHTQAIEMLQAVDAEDDTAFDRLYDELKVLCEEHEGGDKNHPVQWEALADFTEDVVPAMVYYNKALNCAQAIEAHDYIASIAYSVAVLLKDDESLQDENNREQALAMAKLANKSAANTEDRELQREIKALLKTFRGVDTV
jgi:hypothetical protein